MAVQGYKFNKEKNIWGLEKKLTSVFRLHGIKRKKIEFIPLSILNKRRGLELCQKQSGIRVTLMKVKIINNNYTLSWDKILA